MLGNTVRIASFVVTKLCGLSFLNRMQVDGERPTLSLSSLFGRKMKKRRKKQRITVDDLEDPDTEDDDYKV